MGNLKIVSSSSELRESILELRKLGPVAFVPTMGYLHEGHLSLVRLAKKHAPVVLVSIFVNPTQFNDPKDFAAYPIDLDRDKYLLAGAGVSLLFTPSVQAMYGAPSGSQENFEPALTFVQVEELSRLHEGEYRPGHFRGVATVVSMLFNLVQPDFAIFGEKDFQQLRIIEQLVQDLHFPIKIIRGPIVRESDGLALSSRNVRLSAAIRESALLLSRGLFAAREAFQNGEKTASKLTHLVTTSILQSQDARVEYVRVVDERTLKEVTTAHSGNRIILAAYMDQVRLIDNIAL